MEKTYVTPDLGLADNAKVGALPVAPGSAVAAGQEIVVLESEKTTKRILTQEAGTLLRYFVEEGQMVEPQAPLFAVEVVFEQNTPAASADKEKTASSENTFATVKPETTAADAAAEETYTVPDLGLADNAKVGALPLAPGSAVDKGQEIVVLESEKTTKRITAKAAGTLLRYFVEEGQTVEPQAPLFVLQTAASGISTTAAISASPFEAETKTSHTDSAKYGSDFPASPREITVDVAVVGGGPGGYVAAIRAAQNGLSVALVEARELGGTCLNRGCIPTKALASMAHLLSQIGRAEEFGIEVPSYTFSLSKMQRRKDRIVQGLVAGIQGLLQKNKVHLLQGKAQVIEKGVLQVEATGQKVRYKNLIIATGSVVAPLPIPGANAGDILTSDELLELEQLPTSLVLIGGGVIGIEFSFLLAALGCKVYVVEFLPQILNMVDADVAVEIKKAAQAKGIVILESAKALRIGDTLSGGKFVEVEKDGKTQLLTAEKVAVAVGRKPNLAALDLAKLGVALDEKGKAIKTDSLGRTSENNIFAIGDVAGGTMLAHAASRQGVIAADAIAGKEVTGMDANLVPSAIFTDPEIGHIGLSQKEAEKQGIKVTVGRFPLHAGSKAIAMQQPEGFLKIVSDSQSGKILGATMVGTAATELLATLTGLVTGGVTVKEAQKTIYAHPTVAEVIGEALLDVEGNSIHFGA